MKTRPSTHSNTNVKDGKEEKRSNIIICDKARTELRNNSFRFRVGRLWNDLLNNVRNAKNTSAFKNAYDSWFVNTNSTRNHADPLLNTDTDNSIAILYITFADLAGLLLIRCRLFSI